MVGLLRYWGCFWLALSILALGLYDWRVLHHFPRGEERLEFLVLVPGLLFLGLSIVIALVRSRREQAE